MFILALFFGLRREEILECRFGWTRTTGKIIVEPVGDFNTKSGEAREIEKQGCMGETRHPG